jgi:predicted enzyme related to lactoylglutathione lyase
MPNRPAHFEIHAHDIPELAKFYTSVFGWEIKKWEGGSMEYWMIMTGDPKEPTGINGGMVQRIGDAPATGQSPNAFVCTMVVENYEEIAAKILAANGTEKMPKMAIPGMAWQGYFADPEGNIFGLHQIDTQAA